MTEEETTVSYAKNVIGLFFPIADQHPALHGPSSYQGCSEMARHGNI